GIDGIGVMSGAKSKVYLVFYGNQWGSQTTDANGNAKFSNDSAGAAGVAQQMYKGIGTNNELWSADLTQWCDGAGVSTGATSCPSNLPASQFVPYQSGGVLAGVWYDNSAASPSAATGHQLGQEALNAAHHFGNTTAASNRQAFYVILSPTGTNPDNYQGQYCAWHDYNGDSTLTGGAVSSDVGDFAFSNQPYNIDSGAGCGVGFVNSPGTTDGYTITLGHEWHETLSDQNPPGGWTASSGQENSDECAWLSPGTSGGAANINFGSFGTYAEQASWSNDTNNCSISHPIVNHGGTETVSVTNPGNQSSTVGTAISTLQMSATDSSGKSLTYSATGLPAGLSIS
ncbi:putative Ig domain-containing protein, partial [Catenulispora subtropica]|uniref:putative Ig domain-containing protein n=1 Tax=Catenulispora subtropica TaxID=450798 RepID=UPI0031DE59C9